MEKDCLLTTGELTTREFTTDEHRWTRMKRIKI